MIRNEAKERPIKVKKLERPNIANLNLEALLYSKTTIPANMLARHELITRILYTTGLRIGLLLRARVKDIYVTDEARIYLTTKRKVPKTSAIQEIRIEILNKSAKVMLYSWLDIQEKKGAKPEDKLFKKISRVTYARGLQRITEKANMKYKSPHKAKHGFITKMLIKGYTSNQICQIFTKSYMENYICNN